MPTQWHRVLLASRRPRIAAADSGFAPQLKAGQLEETLKVARYSAWSHLLVGVALTILFWRIAPRPYLLCLLGAIGAIVTAALLGAQWCRARADRAAAVDRGVAVSTALSFLLGCSWATMPMALFSQADANYRMLIVGVVAGLISDAFMIGPFARNAFAFCIPLVAGSLLTLALTGEDICVGLATMLLIYTNFVLISTHRMSRLSAERILDKLRVVQQGDTIALLLHDFEEGASDWLWEVDADLKLRHVSARLAQAAGRRAEEIAGCHLFSLLADQPAEQHHDPGGRAALAAALGSQAAFRDLLVRLRVGGALRWWSLTGKPVLTPTGAFAGYRGVGADVTVTQTTETRIAELARSDVLTGLANRTILQETLLQACGREQRDGTGAALLYADLDGFKRVNDTLGHLAGDTVLKEVASRLRACTDPGLTVARLGGDEFAIVAPLCDAATLADLAQRIASVLTRPYAVGSASVTIGVSIGLARTPQDAADPEALLRCADLALYQAKAERKGGFCFYRHELGEQMRSREALQTDLRLALARREFEVHYQPVVCSRGGRIKGCEALLRWRHPVRGLVSPADFIPLAEAQGLIIDIGRWVLLTACTEAAGWSDDQCLAVNLSAVQFRSPDLLDHVRDALQGSRLPPSRLELEITETALLDPTSSTLDVLHALRDLGVRIALDDFGTGYASLSYLLKFPFDSIKIDKSFVGELGRREDCDVIIDAVIELAGRLRMAVTAEGVETIEQARCLRAKGCGSLQGFLFSPARPAHALTRLTQQWTPFGGHLLATDATDATDALAA